jgi:integrase
MRMNDRGVSLDAPDERAVVTLGEVVPQFIELYAKPKNRNWRETERLLNQKFASLYSTPIRKISRPDIVRILDAMIAEGKHGRANHAMAAIKKLLNWALNRGLIDINPIAGMPAPGRKLSRERILTEKEIRLLLTIASTEAYPFGTLYLMLLYTGQRRGEVSGMRWSEIDFDRAIWTLPSSRTKNKLVHEVPLSTPVLEILAAVPRFAGSDFVFTTTGRTPVSGFGRVKQRMELAIGTRDWRVHDLRRTAASGMARLEVAPHVIEKILNHKTGEISGVAAVYNRYGYEKEKRDALERWAAHLDSQAIKTEQVVDRDRYRSANTPGTFISAGPPPLA